LISVRAHLDAAMNNVILGAKYHRVASDGPGTNLCSEEEPLVTIYFVAPTRHTLEEEIEEILSEKGTNFMACNGKIKLSNSSYRLFIVLLSPGWVMNSNPLVNFALPGCDIYLRRELVAWGDSVKLRFGEKPSDSPFLWKFMREYVEQTALAFDGVRLDNCHSTPIHVAEYMLDAARQIRPNLYVIAELFTSSEGSDNTYINRLGINSLIREALSAWDSHEQGRLVHR
jgi:glycogen debranching enzyme